MKKEIKIGLLTLAAIAISIWGYQYLKGKNMLSTAQYIYVEYMNIDMLKASNPVYINGFQVGIVGELYIKESDMKTIVAVLNIDSDIKIPKNAVAEIFSTSVMSGKAVRLVFDGPCSGEDCAKSGDYLKGRTIGMLDSMVGADSIEKYLDQVKKGVGEVFDTLSSEMTDPEAKSEVAKSVQDIQVIISNLKSTTSQLDKLMRASNGKIQSLVTNMESISKNLEANNDEIDGILKNAGTFTSNLKDVDFSKTMTNADDAIKGLQSTLESTNSTMKEFSGVMQQIKSGEGSLGKMVYSDDLYTNLERTTNNLDLLLQDFRLNPKRYVNVSVFGKKQKEYAVPENDPATNNN